MTAKGGETTPMQGRPKSMMTVPKGGWFGRRVKLLTLTLSPMEKPGPSAAVSLAIKSSEPAATSFPCRGDRGEAC